MSLTPDLTPEEIAAVLAARRNRIAVEDDLPLSLTARLDREVAARVDAELALRTVPGGANPPAVQVVKEKSSDGRVVGVVSLIMAIPMLGIVVGALHTNPVASLVGTGIVMGGVVLVNMAQALGRRRHP